MKRRRKAEKKLAKKARLEGEAAAEHMEVDV
jgi:hypothetical protein